MVDLYGLTPEQIGAISGRDLEMARLANAIAGLVVRQRESAADRAVRKGTLMERIRSNLIGEGLVSRRLTETERRNLADEDLRAEAGERDEERIGILGTQAETAKKQATTAASREDRLQSVVEENVKALEALDNLIVTLPGTDVELSLGAIARQNALGSTISALKPPVPKTPAPERESAKRKRLATYQDRIEKGAGDPDHVLGSIKAFNAETNGSIMYYDKRGYINDKALRVDLSHEDIQSKYPGVTAEKVREAAERNGTTPEEVLRRMVKGK